MARYWTANPIASHVLGLRLRHCRVPPLPHPLTQPRVWQIWPEIVFVAICHQANWDKLHAQVLEVAARDISLLFPDRLESLTPSRFRQLFGPAFDEHRLRLTERTELLRSLARGVVGWPERPGLDWLEQRRVTLSGPDGLYSWLDRIEVFSADPLRKKARVLIHQLLRYGLIDVADPSNIAPAVDYHLMRLYVRTARVVAIKPELIDRLAADVKMRIEPITDLRRAVEEAMFHTAAASELRMDQVNHVEWQIGRSFCVRRDPRCTLPPAPDKDVDKAVQDLCAIYGGGCPFASTCEGAVSFRLRRFVEPQSCHAYY